MGQDDCASQPVDSVDCCGARRGGLPGGGRLLFPSRAGATRHSTRNPQSAIRDSPTGVSAGHRRALRARERGGHHHRYAAARLPGALWSRLRNKRRNPARARRRGVRACRVAGAADATISRVDLHRPVSPSSRGSRQRFRAESRRHHACRAPPSQRLRDRGLRLVVRAPFTLGYRARTRRLRRLLRLSRAREPQSRRRRATGGSGDRGCAGVAARVEARLPSVLSLGPPLRSP